MTGHGWAKAWEVVVVDDRMVAVVADMDAAVRMADDLGGTLRPWWRLPQRQPRIELDRRVA